MSATKKQYKSDAVEEGDVIFERSTLIKCCASMLTRIKEKPELFLQPEFETIASLVHEIGRDPIKYPLPSSVQLPAANSSDVPTLSKGIRNNLYHRKEMDLSNFTLQIIYQEAEKITGMSVQGEGIEKNEVKNISLKR